MLLSTAICSPEAALVTFGGIVGGYVATPLVGVLDFSLYNTTSSGREAANCNLNGILLMLCMVKFRTVGEFTRTLSKSIQGMEKGVSMW